MAGKGENFYFKILLFKTNKLKATVAVHTNGYCIYGEFLSIVQLLINNKYYRLLKGLYKYAMGYLVKRYNTNYPSKVRNILLEISHVNLFLILNIL